MKHKWLYKQDFDINRKKNWLSWGNTSLYINQEDTHVFLTWSYKGTYITQYKIKKDNYSIEVLNKKIGVFFDSSVFDRSIYEEGQKDFKSLSKIYDKLLNEY